ncbi:hypothetical protein P7C73_g4780, partial [Tremellales sp. Uapishka_1]
MALLHSLPPTLALSRLKQNLFLLFLLTVLRFVFPPYRIIRRGIIYIVEDTLRRGAMASNLFWIAETLLSAGLLWNVVEAGCSIHSPPAMSTNTARGAVTPGGLKMIQPIKSSPLTRAYPTPDRPSRPAPTSNALTTPTAKQQFSTPSSAHRNSPLSSSTSSLFNLPTGSPSSSTGLFFDSPSKPPPQQMTQGSFVMIDREDREWSENVWKGVRGKGGRKSWLG